jgi:hypothetical protein
VGGVIAIEMGLVQFSSQEGGPHLEKSRGGQVIVWESRNLEKEKAYCPVVQDSGKETEEGDKCQRAEGL